MAFRGMSRRDATSDAPHGKRIVVLGTPEHEGRIAGRAFELLDATPAFVLEGLPHAVEARPMPDVLLVSREWSRGIRVTVARARRRGIPVVYLVDGVIEWSYVWNNQSFIRSEGTVLQPLLASHLCTVGRHQARILGGLGLSDRAHVVGIPRLDDLDRQRVIDPSKPPMVLITTARTPAHNVEQKTAVRRAIRDLKAWFDAHPFVQPVWRIAPELAAELNLTPNASDSIVTTLRHANALISFTSTTLLEGMAMGVPTIQIDYRSVPQYVQTAWEIRSPEHLDGVLQSALYPAPERLAHQDWCLSDELEPGDASTRLADVLRDAMGQRLAPEASQRRTSVSFGRLDYRQVHPQLSAFAVSPMSVLQYELDATSSLLDFAMPALVRLREEVDRLTAQVRRLEADLAARGAEVEAARTTLESRTADHTRAMKEARAQLVTRAAELEARTADHMRALESERGERARAMEAAGAQWDARAAELQARTAELQSLSAEHARAMEALRDELEARAADHERACAGWENAKQSMNAAHGHFMQRVYLNRLRPVLNAVRRARVRQVTVYGAGDVGRAMLAACRANGIAVVRIVDGNSVLWGQAIDGVPVMPVDACTADRSPVVVLASFLHGAAMRKSLRAALGRKKARIFAPARWAI